MVVMLKKKGFLTGPGPFHQFILVWALALWILSCSSVSVAEGVWASGPDLVKREDRIPIVSTDNGEISAVQVADNINGNYLLHFFTLEPNALLLPVVLHADMVFYVQTGSGRLSWTEEDDVMHADLRQGDIHRLRHGTAFFIHSNSETQTFDSEKLKIHAIFANLNNQLRESATGPYSSIRDIVLDFGGKILQSAFQVEEEVVDELFNGTKPEAIIHVAPEATMAVETEIGSLIGSKRHSILEVNKGKREHKENREKLFNFFKEDKDIENCYGWSTTARRKQVSALGGTDIGVFMVNLTIASMMGPHWNPWAAEIAVVLRGRGMVRAVCPSFSKETSCRNTSFLVEEGDVFTVPRSHPMAQMAFNNEPFVFMGFSTSAKENHPQFLAGKDSVLRMLDRNVLAMSFNVTNTTVDRLVTPRRDSAILSCISCAEEEFMRMERESAEVQPGTEEEPGAEGEGGGTSKAQEAEQERRAEEEAQRAEEAERQRQRESEEERQRQAEEAERQRQRESEEGGGGEAQRAEEAERQRQRESEQEGGGEAQRAEEGGGEARPRIVSYRRLII